MGKHNFKYRPIKDKERSIDARALRDNPGGRLRGHWTEASAGCAENTAAEVRIIASGRSDRCSRASGGHQPGRQRHRFEDHREAGAGGRAACGDGIPAPKSAGSTPGCRQGRQEWVPGLGGSSCQCLRASAPNGLRSAWSNAF